MLIKMKKALLYSCIYGLVSACATVGEVSSDANKAGIKKAYNSSTAQPFPIINTVLTALAIYAVVKIPNGPAILQTASNHRLRKLEIKNRLPSTVSVIRHDE